MNIKFEDIIEKANQRKDALIEFQRQTTRVNELCNMLAASANIAEELYAAYMAIDAEGKKLLPPEVQRIMPYLHGHEAIRSINYYKKGNPPALGYVVLLSAIQEGD